MANNPEDQSIEELKAKLENSKVVLEDFLTKNGVTTGNKLKLNDIKIGIKNHNKVDEFIKDFYNLFTTGEIKVNNEPLSVEDYQKRFGKYDLKSYPLIHILLGYGDKMQKTSLALAAAIKKEKLTNNMEPPPKMNDQNKPESRFEQIALALDPGERKVIGDNIEALKRVLKDLEFYETELERLKNTKVPLQDISENSSKKTEIKNAIGKCNREQTRLKELLNTACIPLSELQKKFDAKDKADSDNRSYIQQFFAPILGIFEITGDRTLKYEIERIQAATNPKSETFFQQLVGLFKTAFDAVVKFLANEILDIKASLQNLEGYEKTWVPDRLRTPKPKS